MNWPWTLCVYIVCSFQFSACKKERERESNRFWHSLWFRKNTNYQYLKAIWHQTLENESINHSQFSVFICFSHYVTAKTYLAKRFKPITFSLLFCWWWIKLNRIKCNWMNSAKKLWKFVCRVQCENKTHKKKIAPFLSFKIFHSRILIWIVFYTFTTVLLEWFRTMSLRWRKTYFFFFGLKLADIMQMF